MKFKYLFIFLLSFLFYNNTEAQYRIISQLTQSNPPVFAAVDGDTYSLNAPGTSIAADITGNGYDGTTDVTGFYLIDQTGRVFVIQSVTSFANFISALEVDHLSVCTTCVPNDVGGTNATPTGQFMIWDQASFGSTQAPGVDFGANGTNAALNAAIDTYNARFNFGEAIASGSKVLDTLTEVAHTKQLLDIISYNSGTAQLADTVNFADGVVVEIIDVDNYVIQSNGFFDLPTPHGLNITNNYYIAEGTAGQITDQTRSVIHPILRATGTNSGIINIQRPSDDQSTAASGGGVLVNTSAQAVPSATGNTANLGEVFKATNENTYIVDDAGNSLRLQARDYAVDYTDLRTTPSEELEDQITVRDFTYTFNSVQYTTKGGTFYKDDACTVNCTENGGLTIVATDGTIWKRQWEHPYGMLELWEVGGYDIDGNPYTVFSGEGISGEADRFESVLEFFDNIETEPREYIIDDEVEFTRSVFNFNMNGATLKRSDALSTTLTAGVTTGVTAFEVADPTGFEVGMRIRILDVSATNGGVGFGENTELSLLTIESIVGNTLNVFQNNATGTFVAGDIVMHEFQMLKGNTPYDFFFMTNGTWDGNRANNQLTQDWRYNHMISPGDGDKLEVTNVVFEEYPATCFFPNIGHFDNCTWRNADGPAVHIGSTIETGIYFTNCKFYDVNEFDNQISQHSEAVITFSVGVTPVTVDNCEFINDVGSTNFGVIVGNAGVADFSYLRISNCYAENYSGITGQSTATSSRDYEHYVINNNYFKDCGDISLSGFEVEQGFDTYNHKVTNNVFTNTRIYVTNGSRLDISNNQFFVDVESPHYTPYTSATSGQEAMIQLVNCSDIIFHNNLVAGDPNNNEFIRNGLLLQHLNIRARDDLGALTDYTYMQNVSVKGNTFMNFTSSITSQQAGARAISPDFQTVGWVYSGNTIFMAKTASANAADANDLYGIYVDAGVIADNNKIYMPTNLGNANARAIMVAGIDPAGAATDPTSLMGGMAVNNFIFAPNDINTIRLGNSGGPGEINIIFNHNYYQGNINDPDGTLTRLDSDGNPAFTNWRMDASNSATSGLRIMNTTFTPVAPTYKNWRENKGVY